MELDSVIKNHRTIFNNHRIPGLSLELSGKRYVFSKKINKKNMKLRFPWSTVKTVRDYANMIEKCKQYAFKFEHDIESERQKRLERSRNHARKVRHAFCHYDDKDPLGLKRLDDKWARNKRRRLPRQDRKRLRFRQAIPMPLKLKLMETLLKSTEKELEEIRRKLKKKEITATNMTASHYFAYYKLAVELDLVDGEPLDSWTRIKWRLYLTSKDYRKLKEENQNE
jgi:hypothetical protein